MSETSNRFYNETFSAAIGQRASSTALDAQFGALQAAFRAVQDALDGISGAAGLTGISGFPASYEGAGYKTLRVTGAESGVEFAAAGSMPVKSVSATAYTLLAEDAGWLLVFTSADPVTVTVAAEAAQAFSQGSPVLILQKGSGQVTLSPASGVTLRSTDALLSTRTQFAVIGLSYLGADEWVVNGERNAPSLGYASLTAANVFSKAQTVAPVVLEDAESIATDASLSNTFVLTLGGNRTLANPTNMQAGVILNWMVKQDATGGRTLNYGSAFKWAAGVPPTLSTAANARDFITCQYVDGVLVCGILGGVA